MHYTTNKMNKMKDALVGISLGLLIGAMIGLSQTPVVKNILEALLLALLGFFGLRPQVETPAFANSDEKDKKSQGGAPADHTQKVSSQVRHVMRLSTFSIACVAAILGGVLVRTHNLLESEPMAEMRRWRDAGFSDEQAKQITLFRTLGVMPKEWNIATDPGGVLNGVLKSGYQADAPCNSDLDPKQFKDADAQIRALNQRADKYSQIGPLVNRLPETQRGAALNSIRSLLCD